jgi:hypothetical protein
MLTLPDEFNIPAWQISRTTRPTADSDENGVITWSNFWFEMRLIEGENGEENLSQWMGLIRRHGAEGIAPSPQPVFDYTLDMLTSTGDVRETWEMTGARLITIDFGELDYESNDIMKIVIHMSVENVNRRNIII